MWLPEMAVDHETLEVMRAEGIRFVILSEEQVVGNPNASAGPYWLPLSNGQRMAVFVRDRHLSNALSFGMPDVESTDEWLEEHLAWRCQRDGLAFIATDGETFGHHHSQGVEVLGRILAPDTAPYATLTTLGRYLIQHPPQVELKVVENSSWSCSHRLDRWVVGCDCTAGDGRWKGALRRAFDNLACTLDLIYTCEMQRLGLKPWPLRDDYVAVVLGQVDGPTFLAGHGLGHLRGEETQRLLSLLEAQLYRQRMYASCTFFFEDLDRVEPRYAIANATRAIALTHYATGDDLSRGFRRDLQVPMSGKTGRSGADIFDQILERAEV
jgi:hypothetical protein